MLKATNRKLTGSEKRQIKAVIRRARSGHGNRVSAQQTIPYQRMYPDGICRVDVNRYNKTIQFQDINYQLSENEDKDAIFGSWCEFINYFDSSVSFEFSFLNLENGQSGGDDRIEMTARQDDFDGIREEYAQMLQNQLARGNNGLRKTKYLTFTIEADSARNAKPRLERIEAELLGNFKRMGVHAQALDGKARLALLHGIFHMDTKEPFAFDWDWLAPSGLSTRDFIAPASFEFPDGRTFRIGEKFCSASFLQITAADLSDRALEAFLAVDSSLNLFNHRTNVNLKNRLVCYDIKGLGKQLKKLGMLIVQDQVWNRVTINRAQKKSTRYYMDEFHLLLKEPQTAAYSVEIWKRFRKWGGIPTAITQNLKDLLASAEIENIFENSDFILMLNQAPGDREILAKKLGISARQLSYVKQSGAGEGLLLYGDTILPFVDRFPQDTELYRLMTTRFNEKF